MSLAQEDIEQIQDLIKNTLSLTQQHYPKYKKNIKYLQIGNYPCHN